jgi:hypothetical protein
MAFVRLIAETSFELVSIAIHGKPFSGGEFLKQTWLACEPKLLNLQNMDTILPRVKDRTRS